MSKATDRKFAALLDAAFAAGVAAAAAVTPTPMIVNSPASPVHGPAKSWFVPDGVCGFGWVHVKGNTAFGKWAKKTGHARPDWPTGLSIWSPLRTQSLARNEAWAHGVAKALRDGGIADATGRSRID